MYLPKTKNWRFNVWKDCKSTDVIRKEPMRVVSTFIVSVSESIFDTLG